NKRRIIMRDQEQQSLLAVASRLDSKAIKAEQIAAAKTLRLSAKGDRLELDRDCRAELATARQLISSTRAFYKKERDILRAELKSAIAESNQHIVQEFSERRIQQSDKNQLAISIADFDLN